MNMEWDILENNYLEECIRTLKDTNNMLIINEIRKNIDENEEIKFHKLYPEYCIEIAHKIYSFEELYELKKEMESLDISVDIKIYMQLIEKVKNEENILLIKKDLYNNNFFNSLKLADKYIKKLNNLDEIFSFFLKLKEFYIFPDERIINYLNSKFYKTDYYNDFNKELKSIERAEVLVSLRSEKRNESKYIDLNTCLYIIAMADRTTIIYLLNLIEFTENLLIAVFVESMNRLRTLKRKEKINRPHTKEEMKKETEELRSIIWKIINKINKESLKDYLYIKKYNFDKNISFQNFQDNVKKELLEKISIENNMENWFYLNGIYQSINKLITKSRWSIKKNIFELENENDFEFFKYELFFQRGVLAGIDEIDKIQEKSLKNIGEPIFFIFCTSEETLIEEIRIVSMSNLLYEYAPEENLDKLVSGFIILNKSEDLIKNYEKYSNLFKKVLVLIENECNFTNIKKEVLFSNIIYYRKETLNNVIRKSLKF